MRIAAVSLVAVWAAGCGGSGSSNNSSDPDSDRDGRVASADCNDNDVARWRTVDLFADTDGDGAGAGQAVPTCIGTSPPVGFSASSTDCAPGDSAVHTTMSYAARDADGDTVRVASTGSVCGNGATLPATYFADAGNLAADCDDQNAAAWALTSLHEDFDRDGVGHGSLTSVCAGNDIPSGFASSSTDCAPLVTTQWRMVASYSDVDGDGVGSGAVMPLCVGSGSPPFGSSFLGFDPLDTTADPDSNLISDFDLDLARLFIEAETDDDDLP